MQRIPVRINQTPYQFFPTVSPNGNFGHFILKNTGSSKARRDDGIVLRIDISPAILGPDGSQSIAKTICPAVLRRDEYLKRGVEKSVALVRQKWQFPLSPVSDPGVDGRDEDFSVSVIEGVQAIGPGPEAIGQDFDDGIFGFDEPLSGGIQDSPIVCPGPKPLPEQRTSHPGSGL